MPIAGFKTGETVLTPSGKKATVKQVRRIDGRERVTVAYYGVMLADRNFDAAALRKVGHPASTGLGDIDAGDDEPDYGGAFDGVGTVTSDADPGL